MYTYIFIYSYLQHPTQHAKKVSPFQTPSIAIGLFKKWRLQRKRSPLVCTQMRSTMLCIFCMLSSGNESHLVNMHSAYVASKVDPPSGQKPSKSHQIMDINI